MAGTDARYGIEATMGRFFPPAVWNSECLEKPYDFAISFDIEHKPLVLHDTNLINRLTLPSSGKGELTVENHLTSQLADKTVWLGFTRYDKQGRLGWIISNGMNRYDIISSAVEKPTTTFYERTNQGNVLRRRMLATESAQLAVQQAVVYLAEHKGTQQAIQQVRSEVAESEAVFATLKTKDADGTASRAEAIALKKFTVAGFPPGPWSDMSSKIPLLKND